MNKRVLAVVLALVLFMAGFVKAGAVSYHEGDVEEYVMQQLAAANIPGVSLSIVNSQKEIYSVAFGDVKETTSDLQICALSRTFTTLAVMQLVEKGNISLDDKVSKYIKDPSQNIAYSTTIQDLLSYTRPGRHELALADALEIYNPGTEGEDLPLNTKFNLLGKVVETVSGVSYAEYIKENIITPLDMQSTYTIDETGSSQDITPGSRNYFGLPLKDNIDYKEESYWLGIPSNGIVSNVKDIGKYMQMYLSAGGKIISYNTMESIINDKGEYIGKSIFGTDAYYSMGWISTEVEGEQVYYCNGSVENYTSAMFIIPSIDAGVVMLFNSADILTGQKYTNEIEAGAVSLVMGKTAKAVSSNSYLMEHGVADVIYFLAFVCSIMPLLMMEVWVRWAKDKFSIIRLAADILLHIVLPTVLVFAISDYIAPWEIIMKVMPDLFFVATVVIALFYIGLLVKIIASVVILLKGRRTGSEEDEATEEERQPDKSYIATDIDSGKESIIQENIKEEHRQKKTGEKKNKKENKNEEKEAKEKKDKLLKRMKGIKEAGKSEKENRKTEHGISTEQTEPEEQSTAGQPAGEILNSVEELIENTGQELTEESITDTSNVTTEEDIIDTSSVTTEENTIDTSSVITEKNITDTSSGVTEKNITDTSSVITEKNITNTSSIKETKPGNKTLGKENISNKTARVKKETKPQNSLKNKQGQDRPYNKPKRFVVVNDAPASKRTKGSNIPDSKKNNNKSVSKNNTSNKNRNNKNTNNTANRKKSNYNNPGSRNNTARENNRNNTK